MKQVDNIVTKMKKKYKQQGVEMEEVGGKLKELRGMIAEGKTTVSMQSVQDLTDFKSPAVKKLGKFYLSFRKLTEPITRLVSRMPQMKEVDFYLYSANMKYSARQYVALSVAVAMIAFFVALIVSAVIILGGTEMAPVLKIFSIIAISLLAFFFALIIMMMSPKRRAQVRGDSISRELPFALRHMATELRAGIGLYRTIQAIATADYGDLSEEFARTINEIEEGTDT
ncbi:MAG: type II secretion system F family protein, partial [Nanoarchaeota archaeon]|nr:type II secretion system F family protein [Nanoarchaeota archaeon]